MTYTLREYQISAVDALWEYMHRREGNPLVSLPTGSGKSVVQAAFIDRALDEFAGMRIMCATHVAELIQQNHDKVKAFAPNLPTGIFSAGLSKKDKGADVLFAGVQSVYNKIDDFKPFDLLMIDEAQLVAKKSTGMYARLIEDMTANNHDLRIIGLTATPYRLDSGLLTQKPNNIFTSVCYDADIIKLIDEGYLSTIVPHVGDIQYDTSGISIRGGEFSATELNHRLEGSEQVTRDAVAEIIAEGADRKSWLIFCASVKQAEFVHQLMMESRVSALLVTGKTAKIKRKGIVDMFRRGDLRCLINVNVFSVGFDAPNVDLIALLRPTHSPGLHVQQLGRGMRISPATGKLDCLALDYAGNVARHGPINRVRMPERKKRDGEAPVKSCPECHFDGIHASKLVCPECGYEFPAREVKIHGRSLLDIISRTFRQRVPISNVEYRLHRKMKASGESRTLRVDYYAGMNKLVSEFICVEHDAKSYAAKKAFRWLSARMPAGDDDFPPCTIEGVLAISSTLKVPREVMLDTSEKHPKIVTHFF